MSNITKILKYDLGEELTTLIEKLSILLSQFDILRTTKNEEDISVILQHIDIDMFNDEEKEIIKDLLDAYKNKNIHVSERLDKLEINLANIGLTERDQEEEIVYDQYGNVYKQIVSIPQEDGTLKELYTETYTYIDQAEGKLDYSEKVFLDDEGKTVTVKKIYTYTGDDITKIKTETTIV